jgi:hypothetical protein
MGSPGLLGPESAEVIVTRQPPNSVPTSLEQPNNTTILKSQHRTSVFLSQTTVMLPGTPRQN